MIQKEISNSPSTSNNTRSIQTSREDAFISILQYPTRCKMQLVECVNRTVSRHDRFSGKFLNNWYSPAYAYARIEWDLFGSFQ